MDIEKLKLIMDTLSAMGTAGKEAFIWWLAVDRVLPFFLWLLAIPSVLYTIWRIAVLVATNTEEQKTMSQLRTILAIPGRGWVDRSEMMEIIQKTTELTINDRQK